MKQTQIFQNEYARLETGCANSVFLQLTWLQHASGESFRQVMETVLRHARAQGLRLIMSHNFFFKSASFDSRTTFFLVVFIWVS
ncbi:hypothetical protein FVR03_20285 [Pontibacter qinzhouensis]|uniref:Uncharacterized protein n=1 Tax=Pontibacter qinzhouensis TaxID=2603253 RepID=A0A5C8J265_9BACT|nr:hypothetical protein [Pontibacter qinzhouensis]TXK29861.1 hypothetical protein FVR03_20285 [Pontibacter qinzhouensis]